MREERDFFFNYANEGMRSSGKSFDNCCGDFRQDTFGYEEFDNSFEESFDPNQYNNVRQQPLYTEERREKEEEFENMSSNHGYQFNSRRFCEEDRWMLDPIYEDSCYYGNEYVYNYDNRNDYLLWIIIIGIFFFAGCGFCFF